MGLFGAMTSAVSGLQAQAFAMQNISGNIANSQTIAYKGINTSFEELIPGVTVASQQTAGGVIASSVATNGSQGAIQNASSSTAMAINGDGYFIVQSPLGFTGNTPNFGGVDSYTRRGDFELDAQGYLVNGSGYYLEGMPIDPATGNPVGTAAAPLQFQSNFLPANPTTAITYGVNLPATPQTTVYRSRGSKFRTDQPGGFHRRSRSHDRGRRHRYRSRCRDLPQRIGRWRGGNRLHGERNARQSATEMGKDRQRRQWRRRHLEFVLRDRTRLRPARTLPGKMSAPISSSIRPVN